MGDEIYSTISSNIYAFGGFDLFSTIHLQEWSPFFSRTRKFSQSTLEHMHLLSGHVDLVENLKFIFEGFPLHILVSRHLQCFDLLTHQATSQ